MMSEAPSENVPSERRLTECLVCGYPTPTPPPERCSECGTVFAAALARRTKFLLGSRKFVYAGGVILMLVLLAGPTPLVTRGWEPVFILAAISSGVLCVLWLFTDTSSLLGDLYWGTVARCGVPIALLPTTLSVIWSSYGRHVTLGNMSQLSSKLESASLALFAVIAVSTIAIMLHVWLRHGFQWLSRAGAGVLIRCLLLLLFLIPFALIGVATQVGGDGLGP